MFRLLLIVISIPCILTEPLNSLENNELQKSCGKLKAPVSTRGKRWLSLNTPRATRLEAPFTIAIRATAYSDDDNPEEVIAKSMHACTGTLISPRHVITAAHCVVGSKHCSEEKPSAEGFFDGKIFMASTVCNTSAVPVCDTNSYIRPSKAYIPRAFTRKCPGNKNKIHADFAIIELEKDLQYSDTIQPACLDTTHPSAGTILHMFGYGDAPGFEENGGALRKLVTKVVTWEECENHPKFRDRDDVICSRNTEALACHGDSGGGQIQIKENRAYLTGILNFGEGCRRSLTPNLYMDFSSATVFQNLLVAAITGVNPGDELELDEETRRKLENEYYEYTKENP